MVSQSITDYIESQEWSPFFVVYSCSGARPVTMEPRPFFRYFGAWMPC